MSLLLGPANAKSHLRLNNDNDSLKDAFLRMSKNIASSTNGLGTSVTTDELQDPTSTCAAPLDVGEIRNWKDQSLCIDIEGQNGSTGKVQTHMCWGTDDDQEFNICSDGTIRSTVSGKCLDVDGTDGTGNVGMYDCRVYPDYERDQQWDRVILAGPYTESGVLQKVFTLKNRESGECLDVSGRDGMGNIGTYACDGGDDQKFYVRSRGEVVGHGSLQNEKSQKCLDVDGTTGRGNVLTWDCLGEADQAFTLYQNGELVNERSGQCLDIDGNDGSGNIGVHPCNVQNDQKWEKPQKLISGDYFSLTSKESKKCVDVWGNSGDGNIGIWDCDSSSKQRWKWIPSDWSAANIEWTSLGCHDSGNSDGSVSFSVTRTTEQSKEITAEMAMSIGLEIAATVPFGSVTASAGFSASLSKTWSNTYTESNTYTVTCSKDGRFNQCLYQLQVESSSKAPKNDVKWKTAYTQCTDPGDEPPKCMPGMECADADCSVCKNIGS